MNVMAGRIFVLAVVSMAVLAAPFTASADTSIGATVTLAEPGPSCVGDAATLSWPAPPDTGDLVGYQIEHYSLWLFPSVTTTTVGLQQTSLPVVLRWGPNNFYIRSVTSGGVVSAPFAIATAFAGREPKAMAWDWDTPSANSVGDTTATVSFKWYGPRTVSTDGGAGATVRITASPGGATMDGATATFTGLTNGVGYTFSAVTFNDCGSSGPMTSPVFTPGVAPDWTRHTPPLTAQPGAYVYKFAASGDPSPTFSLVGAPSWLTISPNGLVSGRPPAGVESFSYSVVASNGVGIDAGPLYPTTDILAGPFVITVRAPSGASV